MEKIVSNDTFTRPKKTGQVKFIPQQPGGSPAMFFSVHTGWEQNKAEQTAAAARRRRQCGGSAAGTGSRRQRAKPSKKGVHLHEKKGGWIPSLPIHQSLRPFATAAWPAAPPPLPRVVLTGFFSNGEWRHHRPLGYARPWRQTPFFVSLFRLLLFFLLLAPLPSFAFNV